MDTKVQKTNNLNIKGKSATDVAHRTHKIYGEYKIPQVEGSVVSAGAYYTGEKRTSYTNVRDVKAPAYTLYDAQARYTTKIINPVTFNFGVQNITDKTYVSNGIGEPRTITFSIKTDF